MTFIRKIFLTIFALLSWCCCVSIHVLLQVTFLRKCFLTVITFVLLRWQWLIMAFDNMCVQIIHSVKSLCTYLACEHSIFVHMDFTVPCKVSFFEHISTFVTFLILMPLSVVLVQFGFGHKSFFTLCTGVLKHHVDLAKSRAELALHICQKVRVIH